jgi:hypothetical protein
MDKVLLKAIDTYFSGPDRKGAADVGAKCHPVGSRPNSCDKVPWNVESAPAECQSCVDIDTLISIHDFVNYDKTKPKLKDQSNTVVGVFHKYITNTMWIFVVLVIFLVAFFISFDRYFVINYFLQLGNGLIFRFIMGILVTSFFMLILSDFAYNIAPNRTAGVMNTTAPSSDEPTNTSETPTTKDDDILAKSAVTTSDKDELMKDKSSSLFGLYTGESVLREVSSSTFNIRVLVVCSALFAILFAHLSFGNATISSATKTGAVIRILFSALMFFVAYVEVVELGTLWWSDFFKIVALALLGSILSTLLFNVIFTVFTPISVTANPLRQGTKIVKFNSVQRSWFMGATLLIIMIVSPTILNAFIDIYHRKPSPDDDTKGSTLPGTI